MEKSATCLPEDLLVEILSKLPVRSLGRFMVVCKSWYEIIRTTSFINAQKNAISNTNSPYLLCSSHTGLYSLLRNEELTNYRPCYDRPKLFGVKCEIDLKIKVYQNCEAFSNPKFVNQNMLWGIKVHGSCKGLLCVSETNLNVDSIIYLLNPVIRKTKRIPNVSIGGEACRRDVDLCFGYFGDDYKLIKIVVSSRSYLVGVYSLRTDCWKTINCDHNYDDGASSRLFFYIKYARFVNGVAYFLKVYGGIISFDLYDDTIREIMLPQNINQSERQTYSTFDLEVYRESIAFVEVNKKVFDMWVLNICGKTKISTWEKKVTISLGGPAAHSFPVGFLNDGTYLLRSTISKSGIFYLCNLENSECTPFTDGGEPRRLSYIDSFVGNLVLLNEETIDPFAETAPCARYTSFLFTINPEKNKAPKKEKKERLHTRQDKLEQGRNTKRKIEKTQMEKK